MRGRSSSRAAARGAQNVRFQQADIYHLPFEDDSFDTAFAHTILIHLADPATAMAELRRVLKPGGVLGVRDIDWNCFT